jgi:hypothetical protein
MEECTMSETLTPRSNKFAGLLASMPQLGAMYGEMVAMEHELAAANEARAQIGPLKARIAELHALLDHKETKT